MQYDTDEYFMSLALAEALNGYGNVSPNPLVGAVIVKNGRIIGRGAHLRYGENHAEVNAINSCQESVTGAEIYVTLEPCDHYGKTPPCSLKIIESGIKKVIIGTTDFNNLVNGKGIKRLQDAGIEVVCGVLEDECRTQNRAFFHHCKTGLPFVTLKMATSMDGCLAAEGGNSKWISSEASRKYVHHLRAGIDAVMVGRKTVEADNPRLDVRLVKGRAPYRIIMDSRLTLSEDLNVFSDDLTAKTVVFTSFAANSNKKERLLAKKVKVIEVESDDKGKLSIKKIMVKLGEMHFNSILIEGGSQLSSSFLREKMINQVVLFMAPIILGNRDYGLNNLGIEDVSGVIQLKNRVITHSDGDLMITADVDYTNYKN